MSPARSLQAFGAWTRAISHDLTVHQPPVLGGAKPLVDGPAEKPVLQEPEPGLASVCRRFGTPQFIFVLKHGQVSLDYDPFDEPRDAVQIHHGVKAHGLLPPRVVSVGTSTVLRGTGARAADAHRMPPGRRGGHALLDPQLVLPPAPHVVDVTKLRVPAKPEIRKGNVHWLAVQTWPGVHDAPDAELKEVDRFPPHRHLEHAVKFVQRHGVWHKNAPPDHGADPKQPDLQLQKNRSRLRRCPGIRHATRLQEAFHNASSRLTPQILVVPFTTLLADLGTLTLNEVTLPGAPDHAFPLLATPTELQRRAFGLLEIDPAKDVAM